MANYKDPEAPKIPLGLIKRALSLLQDPNECKDCPECGGKLTMSKVEDQEHYLDTDLNEEDRMLLVDAYVCSNCDFELYGKETMIRILESVENKSYIKFIEEEPNNLVRTIIH